MKKISLLYIIMMGTKRNVLFVFGVALLVVAILSACCKEEVGGGGTGGGGVYVCTGKGANVYHCRRDCGALKNCDGEIKLTISPGGQYERACKKCYK